MLVEVYKVYYKFDCYNKYSCYYLVNESEIDNFNDVKFKYIFKDSFYRIKVYEQICEHSYKNVNNYIIIGQIISDLQLLDYYKFLEFYNLMTEVFKAYIRKSIESVQSDLDLILINWDVS